MPLVALTTGADYLSLSAKEIAGEASPENSSEISHQAQQQKRFALYRVRNAAMMLGPIEAIMGNGCSSTVVCSIGCEVANTPNTIITELLRK